MLYTECRVNILQNKSIRSSTQISFAKRKFGKMVVNVRKIGYWYTMKHVAWASCAYYHVEQRHQRDIERCCDSQGRGLEPNQNDSKYAWAYSDIFFVWEESQDKCLVWPKCKLTLSVYWAKGRGATAKGRGRDHVNGSASRKWSGRPLVAWFLVDLLLVRSQGGAQYVCRHNNYSKPKQEYNSD